MAVIGTVLYRRLVIEKSGVAPDLVTRVLDAADAVLSHLLDSGGQVRVSPLGTFKKVKLKATKKRIPSSDDLVDVPERERIVFKQTRLANKQEGYG